MIILKSAAYYALIDEELEEILSCDNEPVLRAYVAGLISKLGGKVIGSNELITSY